MGLFAAGAIAEPTAQRFSPAALADINGTLYIVAKDDAIILVGKVSVLKAEPSGIIA